MSITSKNITSFSDLEWEPRQIPVSSPPIYPIKTDIKHIRPTFPLRKREGPIGLKPNMGSVQNPNYNPVIPGNVINPVIVPISIINTNQNVNPNINSNLSMEGVTEAKGSTTNISEGGGGGGGGDGGNTDNSPLYPDKEPEDIKISSFGDLAAKSSGTLEPSDLPTSPEDPGLLGPCHLYSTVFWSYFIIMAAAVAIAVVIIHNSVDWEKTLPEPVWATPFEVTMAFWGLMALMIFYVAYRGHILAIDHRTRNTANLAFGITVGLILAWFTSLYRMRNFGAALGIGLVIIIAIIWWTSLFWCRDRLCSYILIILGLWMFYRILVIFAIHFKNEALQAANAARNGPQ